ncbi:MAG: phenylalanine--tRNA ligase beta subunit-related protein [Bacteroidota bacterium]
MQLHVDSHPLLDLYAFVTTFPRDLGDVDSSDALLTHLRLDAEAPVERDETLRLAVRDLFRHGGYKPTGRGKPASEYLVRAAENGRLGPINAAVDACNVVSLHSGLPISVVDLGRADAPYRVGIADQGVRYVFNASGQEIDLGGLLCLFDAGGPCANGVKDSQRTKTHPATRQTLSLIWGTNERPGHAETAGTWYRSLLTDLGATTSDVSFI